MRKLLLLGASGSIGSQTIEVLQENPADFELVGFSIGHQVNKVEPILSAFPSVKYVCLQDSMDAALLKRKHPDLIVFNGDSGLEKIVRECPCDMVVNALVGFAGLVPSYVALELNKILCLANKESLVVGGALLMGMVKKGKGTIYPIDSEHASISKLLSLTPREDIDTLYITASGGSFRDKSRHELEYVTPSMALAHPTWKMGDKITIDSATMMNKGFELIEAKWLFDFPLEQTKILMHRESKVHACLKLKDGSYLADVSFPDMKGPIAYALSEGKKMDPLTKVKDLNEIEGCHFGEFDPKRYPAVNIALNAFAIGGTVTCVLNAANEVAVHAFLDGKLPFASIEKVVCDVIERLPVGKEPTLKDLIQMDGIARETARKIIGGLKK